MGWVDVRLLPIGGWPRKLAGGGGGSSGCPSGSGNSTYTGSGGGGSCLGVAGGHRYLPVMMTSNVSNTNNANIRVPASGPGAGGSCTHTSSYSQAGGAGEGSWRFPITVIPGELLYIHVGRCASYGSSTWATYGEAGTAGMMTLEWSA